MRKLAGSSSSLLGGLAPFTLAASGALTVFVMRAREAREVLRFGTAALALGVWLSVFALDHASVALFFAGTALAGAGFGSSFQGAIRSVVPLTESHERAGVLSVLYVISYLSMGLPAVIAGTRVVYGGGITNAAHEYGFAVMLLAGLALAFTQRREARSAAPSVVRAAVR